MKIDRLIAVAQQLVAPVKGILAADESGSTIQKRFDSIDVDSTEKNRRDYRELLFRTRGVSDFISGVILYDETLRQNAANGTPMVDLLRERGIVPGIKVDRGTKPLAGAPGELITEGLDGLRRLEGCTQQKSSDGASAGLARLGGCTRSPGGDC